MLNLHVLIGTLISSKTRIKLLLKFFLNDNNRSYLRGLEQEFDESSNAIRLELKRLEAAGLLKSINEGNRKYFHANRQHPLFLDIKSILHKHVGFDKIIENIIEKLGTIDKVYVLGSFARGLDSNVIDLMIIGDVNLNFFLTLVEKAEKLVGRRIRYIIYGSMESVDWEEFVQHPLLLWEAK